MAASVLGDLVVPAVAPLVVLAVGLVPGLVALLAVAAGQRGYFGDDREVSCGTVGDTLLTVVAGPLNYVGVNPKVDCDELPDDLPQPSE